MRIEIEIELTEDDEKELAQILRCAPEGLSERLVPYGAAAVREYIEMFLGRRFFRRGSDHNEYRLLLLILGPLGKRMPDEREVSKLFQTTVTESRALIRAVMAKYQYILRQAVDDSLGAVLKSASREEEDGPYSVAIQSKHVLDELNRLLAEMDGSLPAVRKKTGCVSIYTIAESSFVRLCRHLGLNEAAEERKNV